MRKHQENYKVMLMRERKEAHMWQFGACIGVGQERAGRAGHLSHGERAKGVTRCTLVKGLDER